MARVYLEVELDWALPPEDVWQSLVDWPSHGDWIPATSVRMEEVTQGSGTRFVARTWVGPIPLDDHMTVTRFDPAERTAHVEKTGPFLVGTAGFEVRAVAQGCQLWWFEDVHVPGLPSWCSGVAAAVGRVAFRLAFWRLHRLLLARRNAARRG